jgi:hypothetical protein
MISLALLLTMLTVLYNSSEYIAHKLNNGNGNGNDNNNNNNNNNDNLNKTLKFLFILLSFITLNKYGFNDETSNNRRADYLSTWSVFNKNQQSMLGSLDGNALLQQYVAGFGSLRGNLFGDAIHDDVVHDDDDDDDDDIQVQVNELDGERNKGMKKRGGKKGRRKNGDKLRDDRNNVD